jgi:TonB-linked SusC/RagA family outer membrane protein
MCQKLPSLKMIRLLLLIIFVNGFLYLPASAESKQQFKDFEQKITISFEKISLKDALDRIAKQASAQIMYGITKELTTSSVSMNVKNMPLKDVLNELLRPYPLSYKIIDDKIVISREPSKSGHTNEKSKTGSAVLAVKGRITDTIGMPLAGATVRLKGTNRLTITDSNGRFQFEDVPENSVLQVSFIGYKYKEIRASDSSGELNIVLKVDDSNLGMVTVVSTGYQTLPKERATGSFVQVDSALINRRVSTDILSRLEGVVPGLLFNRNTVNSASGQIDISIDGHSTINANDQPLIVVDGFAYDGDYNNINPNDVESITVLKDAAAASIWGVRSGNGVIVITTKKGKRNQDLKAEFNANVTIGNKPDLYYSPNFLDANDFINLEETLFTKGVYDNNLSQGYLPVTPVVALLAAERAGTITTEEANNQTNAYRNIDVRNDLTKYFYQKSIDQQYNLNLRGGGDRSDYYFSFGDDHNRASLVGNEGNRITINSKYNFYPVKHLQVSAGINYVQTSNQINNTVQGITTAGYGNSIYPYAQLVDKNGNALPVVKQYAQSYIDTVGGGKFLDWNYRPYDELRNSDNTETATDNRIDFAIKYDFLKHFSASVTYQYEKASTDLENNNNINSYYARNLINEFTQINPDGSLSYPVPLGGILQTQNTGLTMKQARAQLNYSQNWNKNDLTVIAGTEINEEVNESSANTAYGYDKSTKASVSDIDYYDTFSGLPQNYGNIPTSLSYGRATDHYISYYSNAAYTFNGRYTYSLSGRIDQSNLFGVNTNQKAVPLYSTGFAWNLNREKFYAISWLPLLKLRATYGYTGNIDKSATAITTIQQGGIIQYYNSPYAYIANPGNPDLRWEKIRKINFGVDFGLKDNLITGSVEYYIKKGIDLFGNSPLAPSTGFSTFYGNTADTKGNGLDLVINSRNISTKNFRWNTSFMLSHVVDIVSKYGVTLSSLDYISSSSASNIYPLTGKALFGLYSYKWAGLTHDTGDPQGYLNGKVSTDYAAILSNTTIKDMIYNGSSRPTTFGSFRNTFTYKQWSFSANIIYKLDYYFRKSSYSSSNLPWSGNVDFSQRWQQPGDELKTNVPSLQYPPYDSNRDTFYANSSILIDNGDNIRLQDITLSYDLIKEKIKTLPFTSLQLYGYLNNAGILWRANKDHLDPDLSFGALPLPRTISLGVKANF